MKCAKFGFARRANVTKSRANMKYAILFTTAQIRCKYKRAKLVFTMKVNMAKSDANRKFSIIFAAV